MAFGCTLVRDAYIAFGEWSQPGNWGHGNWGHSFFWDIY